MKSWTSIPFYLWKNTCRRWLEYPVSPFSKILIPTLLGFLAIGVLTLFAEIERELRDQLAKNSIYSVYVSEFVTKNNAPTVLQKTYEEELIWASHYGNDAIKEVRQPLLSVVINRNKNIALLAYTSSLSEFQEMENPELPPSVWLLSDDPIYKGQTVDISLGTKRTRAGVKPVPKWVRTGLSMDTAAIIPVEMITTQLNEGFINHTVANFKNVAEVESFVKNVTAYYRAENRQVKIISALDILKNLEQISKIQAIVRTLIVIGCGVILALTLGSIAWLEYRQDSYLLALLKSFGTPSIILLFHMFFENLVLVLMGIGLVSLSWAPLYKMAGTQLHSIGLTTTTMPPISIVDIGIIVLSGFVGVVFAMIPVAFGLRKPAGLILQ
jgi:ABC-type antimicrobial peptide transport system permease subunit